MSMEDKELYQKLLNEVSLKSSVVENSSPSTTRSNIDEYLMALRGEKSFIPDLQKDSILEDFVKKTQVSKETQKLNEQETLTPQDKNYVTRKEFEERNKGQGLLIQNIQKSLSLGGGGEVNFRYLDDVNRSTMASDNDNFLLEYDARTGKVQFTDKVGPIDSIKFNPDHIPDNETVGTLSWNQEDETLNLFQPGGVVQQIGQELYGYVRNETGSLIPNGTVVRFGGAVQDNGDARLLVTPFAANGEYPSLYTLGITTSDIDDNTNGRVTVWGKVRNINASGSNVTPAETWIVGDVLYVHPTDAGNLTKVKPTSPNNVIPIAAVLDNDSSTGEMFVRPTVEQRYDYATVSSTETQNIDLGINTPHEITLNVIIEDRGITIDSVDSSRVVFAQSGLYAIGLNVQILSSNSAKKEVFFWIRENGIDVPFSTRTITIVGNNVYTNFGVSYNVSAQAGDYVQFMWASTDVAVVLESGPISAFAPTSPSVYIHIDQAAL